jgi:DNA replication initiation complex subunit (GINS family)
MDKANKITYEILFDLLRNEKNREELQVLDKDFFADLVEYIQDKEKLVKDNTDNQLFSSLEKEKTLKQLDNAKKLVKELYERREKKILNMAMISSRAGGLLDKSSFLPEEQQLFDKVAGTLEIFKTDILYKLLGGNIPELRKTSMQAEQTSAQAQGGAKPMLPPGKDTIMIRFLHPVPKFVGKELEVYGPFESEDIANLPAQIADILITKGRAEIINA